LEEWTKDQLVKITEGYKPKNIYNADETRLLPNKTLSLKGEPCNGKKNSNERIMVFLAWSADGTYTFPPFIAGKNENSH
jgi:hypothetical protein